MEESRKSLESIAWAEDIGNKDYPETGKLWTEKHRGQTMDAANVEVVDIEDDVAKDSPTAGFINKAKSVLSVVAKALSPGSGLGFSKQNNPRGELPFCR